MHINIIYISQEPVFRNNQPSCMAESNDHGKVSLYNKKIH